MHAVRAASGRDRNWGGEDNVGFRPFIHWAIVAAGLAARACGAAPMPNPPSLVTLPAQHEPVHFTSNYRRGDRLEVHAAYIRQPEATGDSQGFLGLRMKSNLGAHLPSLQAEIDYGSFDPQSSLALDNKSHRSLWFGAQSAWRDIQYGVSYQSMGLKFVPLAPVATTAAPGTNRVDVWGQRQFGKLGVRTFAWHSTDQARPDNVGSRLADTAVGTAFNYVLSAAPHIDATLSYSRQVISHIDEPNLNAIDDVLNRNVSASLSIRRDNWNATASSSYTYRADCTAAEGNLLGIWTETVAATYAPHPDFSIAPSFTFQDEAQGNHSRTRTRSAAVAVNFRPAGSSIMFTANGYLGTQSNTAWSARATNFNSQAGISMPLPFGTPEKRTGSLALQLGYSETNDAYTSTEDLTVHLDLTLHAFN